MRLSMILGFIGILCGCGPQQELRPLSDDRNALTDLPSRRGDCRKSEVEGCIDGSIVAAPNVSLNGVRYFNGEELGRHLVDHISAETIVGFDPGESMVEYQLDPQISNENFTDGFHVYGKGPQSIHARASRQGGFKLNLLMEGFYELVVQKQINIDYAFETNQGIVSQGNLCGVLYEDKLDLYVEPNERLYLSVDSFRLRVSLGPCIHS